MRSGRRVVVLAGLLAVVAGCGSGSPVGSAAGSPVGSPAGSPVGSAAGPDGPPLARTEWQLAAVLRDGSERPPSRAVREALLRLDGRGSITGIDGCNAFGGDVRVAAATLTVSGLMTTDMYCNADEVPRAFQVTLVGTVSWSIRGGRLRLIGPAGAGLVFAEKPSIYPAGDVTPLLLGRRDGGDYRLGWSRVDGLVTLAWNWRDAPGRPWGEVGLARDPAEPAARPDPMTGAAGRAAFVLGLIRADAVRLVYRPPGGRAVPLQVFRLPGVDSLVAYGGFVARTRRSGAVVVAYRADGTELGRSIPLPPP